MARAKVFSTRVRSWDLLNENLKPHLAEMPQVQPLQTELQEHLEEARALDTQQEDLRAQLRDLVHRRQELEKQGEIVRRRVEAHLRGTYGYTAEQLIKFGVKPRPRVIRRRKATPPEKPPTAETPQETPPAE
jgi:regulator of replication initiation timing